MGLKLYRRHRKECEGGHAEDARSGEFEEGRRGWKRCACIIHASGSLGGKFQRRQTGKSDWHEARTVAASWESSRSWDGEITPMPEPCEGESLDVTVAEAVDAFLAKRKNRGI